MLMEKSIAIPDCFASDLGILLYMFGNAEELCMKTLVVVVAAEE